MMLDRLLEQLKQRGLSIEPGAIPGQLNLCGPNREKTPEIIRAVKAFKPQLMERMGIKPTAEESPPTAPPESPSGSDLEEESCRKCGRTITKQDREILKDPIYCSHPGGQCPYKQR